MNNFERSDPKYVDWSKNNNNMKKQYQKPQMAVVKLRHRTNLLVVSNAQGNAFNGGVTGSAGQGRAHELDGIDDEW